MSDIIPSVFRLDQATGQVDFVNDTMKVAFMEGNFDDGFFNNIKSYDELTQYEIPEHAGYVTGGITVDGKEVVYDAISDNIIYNMYDVCMRVDGGRLGPIRFGVLYNVTRTSHNIVYIFDFLENKFVNDGAKFKIKISDKGLMRAYQGDGCNQ